MSQPQRFVFLGIVSGLLGAMVVMCGLQAASVTAPYLAASRALEPGVIITATDLRTVEIQVDDDVASRLYPADEAPQLVGALVQHAVARDQLIPRTAAGSLIPLTEGLATITIPTHDRAVWRAARPGSRVHIWAVYEVDQGGAKTFIGRGLLLNAYVMDTLYEENGERLNVTLAIPNDPLLIDQLAAGIVHGNLIFVTLPPDPSADPPTAVGEDPLDQPAATETPVADPTAAPEPSPPPLDSEASTPEPATP